MDGEKTYSKLAILTTITATLTSTVSAVISGNSQIPATGFTISDVINLILFWDLGSGAGFWTGLAFFIATWGGFYYASKPLLLELYGFILDNFPTSDRRNRYSTTEEGEPKGVTGLALTSSFVTAQVIGQFFGFILMAVLGGIGLLVFLYSMIKGSQTFRNNFNDTLSSNSNDGGDGGNMENLDEELEEMKEELKDELGREEDIKQKISRLRGEQEDFDTAAEELAQSGKLPDEVQNDLEYLRQEMDNELQKENSLAEILDQVVHEEEPEIEELDNVEDLAKYIEREFSHLMEMDRDLDQRLEELRAELEDIQTRENQDGASEEVREEIADFNEKLEATKAEIQEAVSEAQDASQKADEAMAEIEQIDQQTAQTEEEVEEAKEEDEQVKSEAMDEDERYDAVMQKMREYQDKIREADKERWQEDMREIHGVEEMEEEVAEEEDKEVNEAYDEMMKIDHAKEEIQEKIRQDNSKINQVAEDLKQKTDEIQEMEDKASEVEIRHEKVVMEQSEFNQALNEEIGDLKEIEEDILQNDSVELVTALEQKMEDINRLRGKMPSELRTGQEAKELEAKQGQIYSVFGEISEELDRRGHNKQLKKLNEIQMRFFPPLIETNRA